MRSTFYLALIAFFLFSACSNSFESKIISDPRVASGKEYGTGQPIKPKTFSFGDYLFVTGFADTSFGTDGYLVMYYNKKEILSENSADGYFDSVAVTNVNNDGISDFLIYHAFEDGDYVDSLISTSKTSFTYQLMALDR